MNGCVNTPPNLAFLRDNCFRNTIIYNYTMIHTANLNMTLAVLSMNVNMGFNNKQNGYGFILELFWLRC